MKRIVGSPGTWSGMALRVSQCVFAAASVFAMVSAYGFSNYGAYFLCGVCPLLVWISPAHLLLIVIVDWAMAVLMFSGVCAAACLTIFFMKDVNFCEGYSRLGCNLFALSVTLAFITWSLQAASSFSGFWLLVSFF